MNRDRKAFGKLAELRQRAPPGTHVVFRMHFQPFDRPRIGNNIGIVLRLVSDARMGWQTIAMAGVKHLAGHSVGGGIGPVFPAGAGKTVEASALRQVALERLE